MKFKHLSDEFYKDHPQDEYPEMMLKENRPYTQVITEVNGLKFGVPLRSDINHKTDVLWTNKDKKHGLDFTKAVIITKEEYLSEEMVFIRNQEHKHLLGKEYRVKEKMEKCIKNYIKAYENIDAVHNREYCSYSTLQYYHKELGIEE